MKEMLQSPWYVSLMNSFCWPRLFTFCCCCCYCCTVCVCARVCICKCVVCAHARVWHLYICEKEWWVVLINLPLLEEWNQWRVRLKTAQLRRRKWREHCRTHTFSTRTLFCVLMVLVCAWFNIFPLKLFPWLQLHTCRRFCSHNNSIFSLFFQNVSRIYARVKSLLLVLSIF